jgi:predicted MFS family arabinose efflux permease
MMADAFGFRAVFATAAVGAMMALALLTARVQEPRHRVP